MNKLQQDRPGETAVLPQNLDKGCFRGECSPESSLCRAALGCIGPPAAFLVGELPCYTWL